MSKTIRVLIVDDSAFARFAIAKRVRSDANIEVIGHARDGIEAIEQTKRLCPDVITMDVTMPRMDGIEAVERIMQECPTPIVMLSALTREGADVTLKALELGAVDFFLKHSVVSPVGPDEAVNELVEKIKVAAGVKVKQIRKRPPKPSSLAEKPSRNRANKIERVIIIGSSTGGPGALNELMPSLPGEIPAAILIVQHMPVGFTKSLATRLDDICEVDVKEAEDGDRLRPGLALLAPGGYHMRDDEKGRIELDQGPQECGLRPAVNVTMESAAEAFGRACLGVVLTGMGHDGMRGCGIIKKFGGEVIVEDASTCVVYGMPKSVVEAGHADSVLPLYDMAEEIVKRISLGQETAMTGV